MAEIGEVGELAGGIVGVQGLQEIHSELLLLVQLLLSCEWANAVNRLPGDSDGKNCSMQET